MSDGSVIKARAEERYLLCVVYSPNRMPARGADGRVDVVRPEVLEKAAWRFAENGFRIGTHHRAGGEGAARVVESWIHRGPKWKLRGPDGHQETIRKGDWLIGMILSPETWNKYKRGEFGGVSLQGNAARKPASASTLAGLKG